MQTQDYKNKQIQIIVNLINIRKFEEAFLKSKPLIKKFPKEYIFYNAAGMSLINLERYDEALEILNKAKDLDQSNIYVLSGLIGVSLGANLLIEGSIDLAHYFGIRETVIGLGVLAFGTSLPEVATSIIAAIKKENNIAIGNIVGSNIFNILGIGGVTILISGNDFLNINNIITIYDIIPFLLSTIILVYFYKFNANINRLYGIIFVIFYLIWIFYIFLN